MSDSTRTSVYVYSDHRGDVLYVGITDRGTERQGEHLRGKVWWPFVASQVVEHFENRAAAHVREVHLIDLYHPPFNVQHNPDHQALRALYLDGMDDPPIQLDPEDLQAHRIIGLDRVPRLGSHTAVYRTRLEDWSVARHLQVIASRPSVMMKIQKGARITQIRSSGRHAYVRVYAVQFAEKAPDSIAATVRAVSMRPPITRLGTVARSEEVLRGHASDVTE